MDDLTQAEMEAAVVALNLIQAKIMEGRKSPPNSTMVVVIGYERVQATLRGLEVALTMARERLEMEQVGWLDRSGRPWLYVGSTDQLKLFRGGYRTETVEELEAAYGPLRPLYAKKADEVVCDAG